MNKPILPNFLIVGAMKSGTTSLWNYLRQHPQIFMARRKEPLFFVSDVFSNISLNDPRRHLVVNHIDTLEKYKNLFTNISNEVAIGEATPSYLYYHKTAIPKIIDLLGDVKIILVIRNPVERAFSAYKHLVRDGYETKNFESCLEMEPSRIKENWTPLNIYLDIGLYYNQVWEYKKHFNQVQILLYDDLMKDIAAFLRQIFGFLEVDQSFTPNTTSMLNVAKLYKSNALHRFINTRDHVAKKFLRPLLLNTIGKETLETLVNYFNEKNKLRLNPITRLRLINFFKEDILQLQDLIKKDLSHWLS